MLSRKLNSLMDKKEINANQLSIATGIPYSSVLDWVKGKTEPKADKLLILSKYFGVSIEYFLEEGVME